MKLSKKKWIKLKKAKNQSRKRYNHKKKKKKKKGGGKSFRKRKRRFNLRLKSMKKYHKKQIGGNLRDIDKLEKWYIFKRTGSYTGAGEVGQPKFTDDFLKIWKFLDDYDQNIKQYYSIWVPTEDKINHSFEKDDNLLRFHPLEGWVGAGEEKGKKYYIVPNYKDVDKAFTDRKFIKKIKLDRH